MSEVECEAKNYGRVRECEGPAKFRVVYRSRQTGVEIDSHPVCFRHGLAEIDRHDSSGGIALCEMEEA